MDVHSARRFAPRVSIVLAVLFVAFAVTGGIRSYSPVPYWDSWDGYLGFFMQARSGDAAAWWAFHNEHRIVLSRLLFYIDLAWMGGTGILPTIATYVLSALGAALLCVAANDVSRERTRSERLSTMALIVGLMFCWSQRDNFIWAFQSQFLFAVVLPLAALYLASRSLRPGSTAASFVGACALGVLALGSMANGVLALPAVFVYGWLMGMPLARLAILGVLSLGGILTARWGYPSVQQPVSLIASLLEHPLDTLHYSSLYLGSPLWYALPHGRFTRVLVVVVGAGVMVAAAARLPSLWRHRRDEPVRMAMLTFLAFVGATALCTALGRQELGMAGALTSRYTSPALAAWCALLVVWQPRRAGVPETGWERARAVLPIGLLLVLLPWQVRALRAQDNLHYTRDLAALALVLQVPDDRAIHEVYPVTQIASSRTRDPRQQRLSVFGTPALADLPARMGEIVSAGGGMGCEGAFTGWQALGASGFQRVEGWLNAPNLELGSLVLIIDSRDTIVGFALSRARSSLRPRADGPGAAVFTGYARGSATTTTRDLRACAPSKAA